MKKALINSLLKILSLLLFPLVVTTLMTGIHKDADIIKEDARYVRIKSASADEAVETGEFVLGVTAGLMADRDFGMAGTSELAKMYGVLVNTYISLKSSSSLVLNADNFDLNYINPEKRKIMWGSANCAEYERMLSAWLSEVSGIVIKSDGNLITPYFHKLSAGATRPGPENYLLSVDTSYDLENTGFLTVTDISAADFYNTIMEKYPDCQLSESDLQSLIQIISRDSAGYVTKILVGTHTLSGEEFADTFNLPSPSFTINYKENTIKFIVKGNGHGYGISLNYASYLAQKQYTYDAIIGYFYDNIQLTSE